MAQRKPLTEQERYPDKFFSSPEGHIRDRILIHDNQEIPREGQFISLNGYAFLVKPGMEVDIPRPVREMLDTRIKTETHHDENGGTYTRDIPRITYTLIREGVNLEPAREEVPDLAESSEEASDPFS